MKIVLRSSVMGEELYVNGVLLLARESMSAREALQEIKDFSGSIEIHCDGIVEGGDLSLFDGSLYSTGERR